MNRPTIYFVDINDPDETGTYESNYRHTVLAADYDALLARAKTAEADFLAAAECNVEQRKTIQRFQTELATERLRADAAVGDANAAERRAAELERWIRRIDRRNDDPKRFDPEMNLMIRQALAGQPQQGEPEWPKEQCPTTGAIRDVDPADLKRAALAPAATAVVMPERMTTIPEGKTISYAAGYEAALDAVANLNRNTVPLELLGRISQWPCADHTNAIDELRAILGTKP